jgi:hypothetical protein
MWDGRRDLNKRNGCSATPWPEICEITDKRSQTVMDAFQR